MSLINDALKTAQQEKARRASEGMRSPTGAVLVPLRAIPRAAYGRGRIVTLSVGGLAVAAVVMLVFLPRSPRPQLPAVPAVTSTILSEAIADSASRRDRFATIPAERNSSKVEGYTRPGALPRVAAQTLAAPTRAAGSTVLQGQPRADTASGAISVRAGESAGRLRIAVDGAREPQSARLFREAVAAHRAGDLPTARSLYERVLVLAPNDADALNNLGVLLSAQREFPRALDLLRRAASIAPKNAGVWNNIGTVFRQQDRSSDAIAAYQHALTLDKRHQGAMVGLAQQYLAIKSPAQARALLEDVVAMNPALAEAQYTLGQVLESQNDRAGAIQAYSAFIRHAPPNLAEYVDAVRRRVDALSRTP